MSRIRPYIGGVGVLAIVALSATLVSAAQQEQRTAPGGRSGREVFETTCIACHGPDGRGTANPVLTKILTLPDFTDCNFAVREPSADWLAVAHNGGPARGFSPLMPPWGTLYTADELERAVEHLRTFCADDSWPRGELNLPRPLVTGKAFPEDEVVVSTSSSTRGDGEVVSKFIYERRLGALNQVEVSIPLSSTQSATGGWATGVGDIALGYKRTITHDVNRGNIFSVSAEVALPVGSERRGLGKGFAIFEPFVTYGQLIGSESFVQVQGGFEIPARQDEDSEAFWRAAVGRSFREGRFGRTWSPMFELLAARPFASGAIINWDVVPQVQITLNARQHIRVNGGIRLPVNNRTDRSPSVIFYFLWDWFDGGLLDGW
ncbi:MAG: cytochrome c [Vicinamibacterales bacterium]